MPNFLDLFKIKTPAYNIFQYPVVENKLDMQIGRNIPVKFVELHAGEEVDVNMTHLTRFMPLVNPIFHKVDIEFIPFFVPFRLLKPFGFDGEQYFNPAVADSERPAMPMITINKLYSGIDGILGSIWDYLRYPTFAYLLRNLINDKSNLYDLSEYNPTTPASAGAASLSYGDLYKSAPTSDEDVDDEDLNGVHINSPSTDGRSGYGFSLNVFRFYPYVNRHYRLAQGLTQEYVDSVLSMDNRLIDYNDWYGFGNFWEDVYNETGLRQDEWAQRYLVYLHDRLFKALSASRTLREVSLLPWLCYTRLIYDWFINTNLTDVEYFPELVSILLSEISNGESFASGLLTAELDNQGHPDLGYFFPFADANSQEDSYVARIAFSLWQRDYFSGALPDSQAGNAVPIPANGNIPDLANARKLQWFKTLNLFGGKRAIDQIFVHRGVKSSDARMDRCEVIGSKKVYNLEISDVLQTSESTINSPQGDFAGHGISYGADHICHYRAEEPGLIMIIGRVRPQNSYVESVPRLIFKSDFYDFEQPEFDNVGMQPIMYDELQCGAVGTTESRVFGWTRKYAEYMTDTDEYHGHFCTSLMNWHLGRAFNNGHPVLNTQFSVIKSDGSDDLNRIFANPGWRFNVISRLRFDIQVSRPLSKVIEFDF